MNEFHFFFETFLKLNNFKIFEMEMNESTGVCFFARMPEVFSRLERRNGESRSGEKNWFAGHPKRRLQTVQTVQTKGKIWRYPHYY